jgi:hypothetical protein
MILRARLGGGGRAYVSAASPLATLDSTAALTAPDAVLLCLGLLVSGLSWGDMGGVPCVSEEPEYSRDWDDFEGRACTRASLRIAGGGRANIDSMSVTWEPLPSAAVRSVEPVGVGGGFGLGIVETQQFGWISEQPVRSREETLNVPGKSSKICQRKFKSSLENSLESRGQSVVSHIKSDHGTRN